MSIDEENKELFGQYHRGLEQVHSYIELLSDKTIDWEKRGMRHRETKAWVVYDWFDRLETAIKKWKQEQVK